MHALRTGALFDVDGTIASSNLLSVFLDLQRSRLHGFRWWLWLAGFSLRAPYFGLLDLIDRRAFNTQFARNYQGVTVEQIRAWQQGRSERFWSRELFPQAAAQIRWHKTQGHLLVIVSGGMAPLLEPLAARLGMDALYAVQPAVADRRLTGRLVGTPPVNKGKVAALREAAATLGIALGTSYAYADHYGDRFFLEAVGHPMAVNPDRRLRALAIKRGWPVHRWRATPPMS